MRIQALEGLNFRNYSALKLELHSSFNVFYGANAQGKTNILEGIFYSAFGISHRTNQEDNLLRHNSEQLFFSVDYDDLNGRHNVRVKRFPGLSSRMKKEFYLDGIKVTPKEHYGALSVVLFSPEDLQFVKGEPALRRRFLDMQISQTDKAYLETLMKYNKVLRQRNVLLKQIRDGEVQQQDIVPWNFEFVKLAVNLYTVRQQALQKLQQIAGTIHQQITNGEVLKIIYVLKGLNEEYPYGVSDYKTFLVQELEKSFQADIARGSTNIGPHRDDLYLEVNGTSLKNYGSQGQQRSAALSLKLSQLEYVKNELEEYPVLLLDDVMSELDVRRRQQLLQFIDGQIQTFITVNDRSLIPTVKDMAFYQIKYGEITRVE